MEIVNEYYKNLPDSVMKDINILYFESLFSKFQNGELVELIMRDQGNDSSVIPFPILNERDARFVTIQEYEELPVVNKEILKEFGLCYCKMHAGLGSSVVRDDLILKYDHRTKLGAKGTDLFIKYGEYMLSIAEVQLLQAEAKAMEKIYKFISFFNLVNFETTEAVHNIWKKYHPVNKIPYAHIFDSEQLKRYPEVEQLMMPTIADDGELTVERMAPAGHGFIGYFELLKIFRTSILEDEILAIGNGEDLKSSPDNKIVSWMATNEIPIVMITTTKLEKDKKGGQLALVKADQPYVTIVEKAQAEKANQLTYFEELGLRAGDERSLFNTNIVLLNKKVLKKLFNDYLDIGEIEFRSIITPDLIKNEKRQDGKSFIQLEGAIGSVMLNLDKYFRQHFGTALIHYLNLAPENREKFFLPIKNREDFDRIYGQS